MKPLLAALAATHALMLASPALAGQAPVVPPLFQSWSNTALIAEDHDWSRVHGFAGHRGDGLTAAAGVDPRTVTADGSSTPASVTANQPDPGAVGLAAGLAEFELEDPAVAIQGSATASAPHLLLSLDTRGRAGMSMRLVLRDIDRSSIADALQQFTVQYRVGSTGEFANLAGGYVADATGGPSQATLVTPVRVALPAAADDQPLVQVRVVTTNAVGQDEWVAIDDIEVTAGGGTGPGPGCPPAPPSPPAPMPPPVPPVPPASPLPPAQPGRMPGPLLSGLEIEPSSFPAALRGPAISRRGRAGAALRFVLTRPAVVRFEVVPALAPAAWRKRLAPPAWRVGTAPPVRRRRPTALPAAIRRFSIRGRRGLNRLRFSGRLGGRPLAPGPYRLLARAVDRGGRRSATVSTEFRITPPRVTSSSARGRPTRGSSSLIQGRPTRASAKARGSKSRESGSLRS